MSRLSRCVSAARGRERLGQWVAALAFAAIFAFPLPSLADPTETKPGAAASDPDYAAGKQALDLQNYLGFSYRKLGQLDAAFEHYRRALELNPRHRGAHEYAGEAYLMIGDLARAEEHLAALRRICLLPCEELGDLEREVAAYRKRAGADRTP